MDTVTVRAARKDDPVRWARLTVGLRDRAAGEPFLVHGPGYACSIDPGDEAAGHYAPANWESGVLSGVGYAWRRWMPDGQGLTLMELSGRLQGGDIAGIAAAALDAAATALGRDFPAAAHADWQVHTVPTAANAAGSGFSPAPTSRPATRP